MMTQQNYHYTLTTLNENNNMNTFKQRFPRFIDVDRDAIPTYEFSTLEELYTIDIVSSSMKDPSFSHFALSDNYLMSITDEGYGWRVLGHVSITNGLQIPKWNGGKYLAQFSDGRIVTLTKEVVSSCGRQLTLSENNIYGEKYAVDLKP